MKKIVLALFTIVAILFTACAGPKRISEEDKLRQELQKWEYFKSQGVIELSYKGFAIRKMFSASKNGNQFRFDVLEGGLLGSSAEPLMSMYVADYVAFKSPFIPLLQNLNLSQDIPIESLSICNPDSIVALYGQEIIKNKKLILNEVTVNFSKNYLLESISDAKSGLILKALYNGSGKLSGLNISSMDNISIRMSFDKIEYEKPQIIPLPKPAASENSLPDFKDKSIESLLKSFLQYKLEQ